MIGYQCINSNNNNSTFGLNLTLYAQYDVNILRKIRLDLVFSAQHTALNLTDFKCSIIFNPKIKQHEQLVHIYLHITNRCQYYSKVYVIERTQNVAKSNLDLDHNRKYDNRYLYAFKIAPPKSENKNKTLGCLSLRCRRCCFCYPYSLTNPR